MTVARPSASAEIKTTPAIVSFTQWTNRRDYENYLTWRTETGMTDDIEEMLTEPLIIAYFDDVVSLTR